MRSLALVLVLCAACSSPAPAPTPAPTPAPAAQGAPPPKIDFEASVNSGRTAMFSPSPTEFEAVLARNAPGAHLRTGGLGAPGSLDGLSSPLMALEAGTRINDVLSAAHAQDRSELVSRIGLAREALVALGAPEGVLKKIDGFVADLGSGALEAGEVVPALDVLADSIHHGLEEAVDPATATLVEAGGWVQGAYALSGALADRELTPDAAALFRQASLVNHFLGFLQASAPARAGDPAIAPVVTSMEELRELAGRRDLAAADVARVHELCGSILQAFRQGA